MHFHLEAELPTATARTYVPVVLWLSESCLIFGQIFIVALSLSNNFFVQGPDPDILAMVARRSEGQEEVEQPAKDQGGDIDIGEGGDGDIIKQGGEGNISRGPLGEDCQGHQGWVWQCGNCGAANTKRGNVIRQKCKSRSGRHKFFFDDQPDKLGDHPSVLHDHVVDFLT